MLNIKKTITIFLILFQTFFTFLFSQESLKSIEEEYYDFLSLQGITERPTLGYRTLSDNVWKFNNTEVSSTELQKMTSDTTLQDEDDTTINHLWQNNNLGNVIPLWKPLNMSESSYIRGVKQGIFLKIYGPEWFNSFNTAAPYGQDDGALWQGKGYNTSLTGGVRLEGYGLELTLKPMVTFSQNMEFEFLPSSYESEYGYFWGYGKNKGADAPQRFGNKPYFQFDFGDTEIRYTWNTLTIGFGTESIWLGPAKINPLLHSNNAASYPKIDLGLRRQRIEFPKKGWYWGDVEARIWSGYLSESEYFDSNKNNNHNLIHGLYIAYSPSFAPGVVISANRICLVKASWENMKYIIPMAINTHVGEQDCGEDQKMSLTFDWLLPKSEFEFYAEIGIDDFTASGNLIMGYFRYPFHTMTYTVGLKKANSFKNYENLKGEFLFEWNSTEMSQDFQMQWAYNFGFHNQVTQGYTNKGQWIGSGIGYGGNSQYFQYKLYYPKGFTKFMLFRNNPDNNYIYSKCVKYAVDENYTIRKRWFSAFKANFGIGVESSYFITNDISIGGGVLYNLIINPLYNPTETGENGYYRANTYMNNFNFILHGKYRF